VKHVRLKNESQVVQDIFSLMIPNLTEEGSELIRFQFNAERYVHEIGCILCKNYNVTRGRTGKRGYVGDTEYFGVYSHELRKV
jgi:hypothetical protein